MTTRRTRPTRTARAGRPARAAVLVAPIVALALLAACSGPAESEPDAPADAGGQTEQEACDVLLAGLQEFSTIDSAKLQDELVNDPQAAIATIDEAERVMIDATDEVTNEEIRPLAEDAADATRDYFGTIRSAAEDPTGADVSGLQAQLTAFTEAIGALEGACS